MKNRQKILKIITALITTVIIVVLIFSAYNYLKIKYSVLPEDFTVTAHTGCEETESNSLDSIRKGYESGADIVEFDLNFTSDGEAVLAHDKEIPSDCVTLDEAFSLIAEFPEIKVNVDCKSVANLKVVTELAQKYGISNRIFYTGIRKEDIDEVKAQTPEVAYWLNFDVDAEKNTDDEYLLSLAKKTCEVGAVGININYETCSKELVDVFHSEGLLVSIWTIDKKFDMVKTLPFCADNITTRHPSQLVEIVELNKGNQ
jgi:glycerophosphoryl diester phosphodiesterase